MAKNGRMGDDRETTSNSAFMVLFVCNQVALLAIAIYGHSVAAAVFFWLGVAFLLSRMESMNHRYCALAFWLGITFAILGYLVIPEVDSFNAFEVSDLKFWFGAILYSMAAILIAGTCYKVFTLPPST